VTLAVTFHYHSSAIRLRPKQYHTPLPFIKLPNFEAAPVARTGEVVLDAVNPAFCIEVVKCETEAVEDLVLVVALWCFEILESEEK
jgi:hypothetical protein